MCNNERRERYLDVGNPRAKLVSACGRPASC